MIAVDANILVYAQRSDVSFHSQALGRMREVVEGSATWAIPWPCVHEFMAVVTNRRVFDPPTSAEDAIGFVSSIVRSPRLVLLAETTEHWPTLQSLVLSGRAVAGLVHDARIAAICIQHGVRELWTADRDYGRFPQMRVVNPLLA